MTNKQKKSPAFQFYPSNFLGSTKVAVMDATEIGVYWLLICLDWEEDGFTLEDARDFILRRGRISAVDFGKIWIKVSRCFETDSERFFNERLRAERKKQRAWRRKSSKGGKIGAARRWGKTDKGGHEVVIPNHDTPSLSPTPSPVTTTTAVGEAHRRSDLPQYDQVFEEAWAAYPKRPGNSKQGSWRAWLARVRGGVDPLDMCSGVRAYAAHCERERKEPKHIKMAQTFFGPDKHFAADWGPVAGPDPSPAEYFAKALGVAPAVIQAMWDDEDAARVIDGRAAA